MTVNEDNFLLELNKRNPKALEYVVNSFSNLVFKVVINILGADNRESAKEDEALILLNDITINEDEFSTEELSELEMKKLCKDIMNKVNTKTKLRKKSPIAASVVLLVCTLLGFTQRDILAGVISRLNVLPEIGETFIADKGYSLKSSITENNITLNNMYVDDSKFVVSLTTKSSENYYNASYNINDENGNSYKLKVIDSAGQTDGTTTYKAEYNGKTKKAKSYTLSAMNEKAVFKLNKDDFSEVAESENLYSTTNGKTTLNITSIKKDGDTLKLDYYVSDTLEHYSKAPSFNLGTFKDEEENIKRGFQLVDSTIEGPYFKIYDEYNNMEYAQQ